MGIQLNIKSEEAHRIASELAELTGESLTATVLHALKQCLETERRARDKAQILADVLAMGAEIRRSMGADVAKSTDTDFLYGEDGLPL